MQRSLEKKEEAEVGEEIHNVFLGNTFSSNKLPISKVFGEGKPEIGSNKVSQMPPRPSFKAKIVPFSRARDAFKSLEQDFVNWEEEERLLLKQVLQELEQTLAQFKARL